jgi:diaminopimelate decarboxylase/aspartate kinase
VEEASHWHEIASVLSDLLYLFPQARFLDVGGGLGIPKHQATPRLDLARVDTTLQAFKAQVPGVDLWMEPGRYVVAEAGVLLARVTQIKQAFRQRFIGLSTGMNSLIRPALYGSYHGIWNLSRIDAPSAGLATIVGPICESADVFGLDREMPDTREDDIILIDNAGAYGHTMASHYNLREPAEPLTIGAQAIQAVAAE